MQNGVERARIEDQGKAIFLSHLLDGLFQCLYDGFQQFFPLSFDLAGYVFLIGFDGVLLFLQGGLPLLLYLRRHGAGLRFSDIFGHVALELHGHLLTFGNQYFLECL